MSQQCCHRRDLLEDGPGHTQICSDFPVFQSQLWEKASNEALTAIEASGVEIIRPDKAPFMAAVEDMKAEYTGTAIGDVLDAIAAQ